MDEQEQEQVGGDEGVVRLDGARLRAVAHPLRARILASLRVDGPATATVLAARLGENTGATSYHLRQLAQHDLVVEDAERGTGRERWWRSAHRSSHWIASDFGADPGEREAEQWLVAYAARMQMQRLEQWLSERPARSREWIDASVVSDYGLRLPPAALHALVTEIHDLIERYREAGHGDHPRAEQVFVFLNAFPRPGPLP